MCNTIRLYAMSLNRHLPCVLQFNLADHFIGIRAQHREEWLLQRGVALLQSTYAGTVNGQSMMARSSLCTQFEMDEGGLNNTFNAGTSVFVFFSFFALSSELRTRSLPERYHITMNSMAI